MFIRPEERPANGRRDFYNLRHMLPYLWDYRGRAALALSFLIAAKAANVGVPLVLKDMVDHLDVSADALVIFPLALLLAYGVAKLASSLFNELRDAVFARVRYRAMRKLSTQVLEQLHRQSLAFHLNRKSGAVSADLDRGTRSVSTILNYLTFNIIPVMVEFAMVAVILLLNYDWVFAAITFGSVTIYMAFTFAVTEWRMEYRLEMNRRESEANAQALDSLTNYETVKTFGNEKLELGRFDATLNEWEQAAVSSQTSMSALNFGQGAIIALGVTSVMSFAVKGVMDGDMSIGDLVLVNAFLLQLFIPLGFLGIVYRQIKYSLADMDRIFKLLERKPDIEDAPDAKPLQLNGGHVQFKNVRFGYQPEREVIKNFSLDLPAGKTVAVVGHSGAGKSTLSRLLLRFYDLNDGEILIDGQEIRSLTQDSLRAAIGIVPQDTVLFHESIRYNIAYADPDASDEAITKAAKNAQVDSFIEHLPDGYNTVVGERGLKLSGGEKQRVAIARAIMKRPRILIFDEATSSLDSATEKRIQTTLMELAATHTTLIIAHRLSTVVHADQIVVMDQGQIVEQGTHSELLDKQGVYTQMWQLQKEEQTS